MASQLRTDPFATCSKSGILGTTDDYLPAVSRHVTEVYAASNLVTSAPPDGGGIDTPPTVDPEEPPTPVSSGEFIGFASSAFPINFYF
jgi:hypothetical protein